MQCISYHWLSSMALFKLPSICRASLGPRNLQFISRNLMKLSLFSCPRTPNLSMKIFSNRNHSKTGLADEDFEEIQKEQYDNGHVPVLLQEVLEVFQGRQLRSFVDCTLGAGGHASAIIKAHPELQGFIGLDIDPAAHEQALPKLQAVLKENAHTTASDLKLNLLCNNFRDIKSVLGQVDENLSVDGVDGILMDLGMSSMQVNSAERGFSVLYDGPLDMRMSPTASLKAEDILNFWHEAELGRILRDYGEESRWQILQRKIAEARLAGGIHSTSELVELVRRNIYKISGRQGWMKTSIRVFQALRIAVNDELKTLESTLSDAFSCLSPKGRLAVISFHSLEDRIVKQSFLNIINKDPSNISNIVTVETFGHIPGETRYNKHRRKALALESCAQGSSEEWSKHRKEGKYATILTKRPIRPTIEEESVNRRCRSAKLRVIEKN